MQRLSKFYSAEVRVRFRRLNCIAPAHKTHHTLTQPKSSFRYLLTFSTPTEDIKTYTTWYLNAQYTLMQLKKVQVIAVHTSIKTHFPKSLCDSEMETTGSSAPAFNKLF